MAGFELRPGVWLQLSTGDAEPEVLLGVADLAAARDHVAAIGAAPSPVAAEGPCSGAPSPTLPRTASRSCTSTRPDPSQEAAKARRLIADGPSTR